MGGGGGVYIRFSVITALTQYVHPGTRGGAVRARWSVNVGWESCYGPSPRCCGGSLSLAVRGGGFCGSKAVTQLIYR